MLTWILAPALAGPSQQAATQLLAQGPHTAVYHKASTDEPVLEVTVNGPREGTARAFSPDGEFVVSVDATHMRLRVAADACASIDARALFDEAAATAAGHFQAPGPPASSLIYRVLPDGTVDLSAAFRRADDPPLLSWHADLEAQGVSISEAEGVWTARSSTSTWTVNQGDGRMARMTVGDDALVLDRIRTGPETSAVPGKPMKAPATLPRAIDVCPSSTAPELEPSLRTQLRLYAWLEPFQALVVAWADLPAAEREAVVGRQEAWWRRFFAEELPGWSESLRGGPWTRQVVADMADPIAFAAFRDQLAEADRPQAMELWKRTWFGQVGQDMVIGHAAEVQRAVFEPMNPLPDAAVVEPLLTRPLVAAAMAEAEAPLQAVLVPVVEEGAAALARALGG